MSQQKNKTKLIPKTQQCLSFYKMAKDQCRMKLLGSNEPYWNQTFSRQEIRKGS